MIFKKYLGFLMGLCWYLSVFASNQPNILQTKVNIFKPAVVPTLIKPGFCWVNSVAVPRFGAWRCMIENNIFDPCFITEAPNVIVCGADPTKNDSGFLLKLTQPLPIQFLMKLSGLNAWMVELEDGQMCRIYTGTLPIIKRGDKIIAVRYGCQSGGNLETNGLLDGSLVQGKVWQAKKITYTVADGKNKIIKIQPVKIKQVWQ